MSGAELKAWREASGLTQEELGRKLGVTREWIGKLETTARPISASIQLKMAALKREQEFSGPREHVQEEASGYGTRAAKDLTRDIRKIVDEAIATARDDLARLGWIREQLRAHLRPPSHWEEEDAFSDDPNKLSPLHSQVVREVLAEERKRQRRIRRKQDQSAGAIQGEAGA